MPKPVRAAAAPIATSQPVAVQEVKPEEIRKVKTPDIVAAANTAGDAEAVPKKKKVTKKIVSPPVETVIETVPAAPAPAVATPAAVAPLPPVEEDDENAEIIATETASEPVKRARRLVTKETLYQDIEQFNDALEHFLGNLPIERGLKNVKNQLLKRFKQIRSDTGRVLKIRSKDENKNRSENKSGFMKPIKVSNELAGFLETNPQEEITRVHVTKKLCQYIKDKELQNPEDRREIIPDNTLKGLFHLKDDEKLTYYSMQRQIQQHIFKA
jgi:upstream activation factor subunit UAF30